MTAGSSAAFILAFTSLFERGEKVAIGEPGYPSYRNILRALDLEPVGIATGPEDRFQPTPRRPRRPTSPACWWRARPTPPAPCSRPPSSAALIERAAELDLAFVSDEIYHGIQYGGRAVSALEISDEVYVINSFSKYFSMTGWRIGWMVVPEAHVRRIERLVQNFFICAPHASQVAALAALDATPELDANLAVYRANRALMLEGLPQGGLHPHRAAGRRLLHLCRRLRR